MLVDAYGHLIEPQWRALDLIASTEAVIHTALREADPQTQPPMLRTVSRGPGHLVVIYASERQMCGLARGIIHGVADHYGEQLTVTDEACMLRGDRTCKLAVRLVSPQAAP